MNTSVLEENVIRSMLTADDEQPSWVFILNISLLVSPLAALHFLLSSGISHQMGRELVTNQEGRTDTNTHSSSSLNSFLPFLLPKFLAGSGEDHGHRMLQIPGSLTLDFSWRSWLSWAKLSLPAPSWLTCFLSSMISLMRLFYKEKNKINCQGVGSKWFLCSEA